MNRRGFLGLLLGAPLFPKVTLQEVNAWSLASEAARARVWAAELTAIVRRAFVPKLVMQLYQKSPLLTAMMSGSVAVSGPAISRPLVEPSEDWSDDDEEAA